MCKFAVNKMNSSVFDYIIVGAGIEGSATAYNLAKTGYKTLLLEQYGLHHEFGSSHGGSRITRKSYDKALYTKMMLEGDKLWLDLQKEYGQQLIENAGLILAAPVSCQTVAKYKSITDSCNLPNEILSSGALRRRFPQLRNFPDDWEALYEPEAGVLFADKCLNAYHVLFRRYGGEIRDNTKVVKILPKTQQVEIFTDTDRVYTCRSVVLCLGAWAGKFTKTHLNLSLPLQPVLISVCYWKETKENVYSIKSGFPPIWLTASDGYEYFLLPSAEMPGLVKISHNHGATVDPDQRETFSNEKSVKMASDFVRDYFPDCDHTAPVLVQQCIYTFTPDNHVILDRHPAYHNVIIGAGFSGHGFKLAPVVGRILCALATNNQKNINYDLSEVSINRFQTNANSDGLRHMM